MMFGQTALALPVFQRLDYFGGTVRGSICKPAVAQIHAHRVLGHNTLIHIVVAIHTLIRL
jgi:hypothetical protein